MADNTAIALQPPLCTKNSHRYKLLELCNIQTTASAKGRQVWLKVVTVKRGKVGISAGAVKARGKRQHIHATGRCWLLNVWARRGVTMWSVPDTTHKEG